MCAHVGGREGGREGASGDTCRVVRRKKMGWLVQTPAALLQRRLERGKGRGRGREGRKLVEGEREGGKRNMGSTREIKLSLTAAAESKDLNADANTAKLNL